MAMMRPRGLNLNLRGSTAVAQPFRPSLCRAAVFAVLAAALLVAGCGRRGPLEPPSLAALGAAASVAAPVQPATAPNA